MSPLCGRIAGESAPHRRRFSVRWLGVRKKEGGRSGGGGGVRLHVGGLGESVGRDDLLKIFSPLGSIDAVEFVRTKGRSFAYIDFSPSSENSLTKLFSTYDGCVWKGGKLRLEKEGSCGFLNNNKIFIEIHMLCALYMLNLFS